MSDYGDDDPEDGYDAGDPIPARLVVLARIAEALEADADRARRRRRRTNLARLLRTIAEELADDG